MAPEQTGPLAEAPLAISAAQGRTVASRTQQPSAGLRKAAIYGGYEFGNADIDSTAATSGRRRTFRR